MKIEGDGKVEGGRSRCPVTRTGAGLEEQVWTGKNMTGHSTVGPEWT